MTVYEKEKTFFETYQLTLRMTAISATHIQCCARQQKILTALVSAIGVRKGEVSGVKTPPLKNDVQAYIHGNK